MEKKKEEMIFKELNSSERTKFKSKYLENEKLCKTSERPG